MKECALNKNNKRQYLIVFTNEQEHIDIYNYKSHVLQRNTFGKKKNEIQLRKANKQLVDIRNIH